MDSQGAESYLLDKRFMNQNSHRNKVRFFQSVTVTNETKSGSMPDDIAVTRNSEQVYTDEKGETINVLIKKLTDTDSDQLTGMETFRCLKHLLWRSPGHY